MSTDLVPGRVVVLGGVAELLRVVGPHLRGTQRFGDREHGVWTYSMESSCPSPVCAGTCSRAGASGTALVLAGADVAVPLAPTGAPGSSGRGRRCGRAANAGAFSGRSMKGTLRRTTRFPI